MKSRILLVEDEEHIQHTVKLNLEMENYTVTAVGDGSAALRAFKEEKFNLVILDIMIPEMDGLQVCENIRLQDKDLPILFLSAKNTGHDRITGLKKGGDDYLTKPFDLEELLLRVNNLVNKSLKLSQQVHNALDDIVKFGNNSVNFENYEATGLNGTFTLTKKEALLLRLMLENKNEVISRERILQSVWGYSVYPSTRTIDNFLLAFRKYFEEDPKNPKYFQSIRGVGYMFSDK